MRDVHGTILDENGFSVVGDVHVSVEAGHGEPSAGVNYVDGELYITLRNIEGNGITQIITDSQEGDGAINTVTIKTEDNPEGVVLQVRNGSKGSTGATGPKGAQGDSAVFDPETGTISTMKQLPGQDSNSPMSQKGITDALNAVKISGWSAAAYKYKSNIALNGVSSVGDTGTYQAYSTSANYKVTYLHVEEGDVVKVKVAKFANDGILYVYFGDEEPAVGVEATLIYFRNSPVAPFEEDFTATSEGYLAVLVKPSDNTYMPEPYIATRVNKMMHGSDLLVKDEIILSQSDEIAYSLTSFGTWAAVSSSSALRGIIVDIFPGKKYLITSEENAVVGILKTGTASAGNAALSDEYPSRLMVSEGNDLVFTAPIDAHFVYLQVKTSAGTATGATIAEAEDVSEVASKLPTAVPLPLDNIEQVQLIITSNNIWANALDPEKAGCKIVHVKSGGTYILSSVLQGFYAFLKDTYMVNSKAPHFSDSYKKRLGIPANSQKKLEIPSDTHYLYIVTTITTGKTLASLHEVMPSFDAGNKVAADAEREANIRRRMTEAIGNPLHPVTYSNLDENGEEIPQTREVAAVVKKSKQLTGLTWTPLAAVPMNIGNDSFPANVPVVGVPYSSVKEIDKYIGYDVSIHTFMTAVNNPYSLLYTEHIRSDKNVSAWGRTYHGSNCGPYFGVVCSVVTGWCTGQDQQWPTAEDRWCAEANMNMIKNYDQSAQGLQIGDIYWRSGHNVLIIGLKRDAEGNVTHVLTSEAGARKIQENAWKTAQQFNTMLANEGGIMYRNVELYKNKYTPSEFVAVGDEEVEPFEYNDDICTFAGDRASFRQGELVVLNYDLKNSGTTWQAIEIYKDNALIETKQIANIDQSELPESQRQHAYKLGTELEPGLYYARLVGSGGDSQPTYWEVVETDVSFVLTNIGYRVSWKSANGVPDAVEMCTIDGSRRGSVVLTEKDIKRGWIEADFERLALEQRGLYLSPESCYLKVHFNGQYGRVTNELIALEE